MKKSFMTRMLAVSLSAAMTFSLSSASSLTATEAAAKKLPANNKAVSISLKVGKSKVLKLKNYKAWNIKKGATNKKAVAAVANKGTAAKRTIKVTAKKKGTAKVTLTLGKRKTADSKTTKYSKTIKKVVTVKVKAADTTTPTDTTDTTPTDTTTPTTPSTTTGSATNVTPGVLHISQAKATHVNVIAVSFSSIVTSQAGVKVTVTRGEGTEPIEGKFSFAADGKGGEFTTVGKLTKGTYVVTATDGKDKTTASVEVEKNQEVTSINFLGNTALTGRGGTKSDDPENVAGRYAYVYYELRDQYGDNVNDTFSAQWTASADIKKVDRAEGRITLQKNKLDETKEKQQVETFNYSDKIYVTGVYTKTGVSGSETFTVGSEQSVSRIDCVGFLEKGTTEIVQTLPKDFKSNEYQLLYKAYDQEDHVMEAADYLYDDDDDNNRSTRSLTFVSLNVLVIKEILHNENRTVSIGDKEYCAANIVPGINVNAGGDVTLNAIATKTGKTSEIRVHVGAYRVLHSFELGAPSGYVIDGEAVEIPFEATDDKGERITTFKELATQTNFSRLTLNESVGELRLEEKDDGSARLVWYDTDSSGARWNKNSTDGVDRPVSLTAIVVGGQTSNEIIQVSDKARPEGIAKIDMNKVYVDRSELEIDFGDDFDFVDQYGRNMRNTYSKAKTDHLLVQDVIQANLKDSEKYEDMKKEAYGYEKTNDQGNTEWVFGDGYSLGLVDNDNGFFKYANATAGNAGLTGTDFSNYMFGVNLELSGNQLGKDPTDTTKDLPCVTEDDGSVIKGGTFDVVSGSVVMFTKDSKKFKTHKVVDTIPEITVKATIRKVRTGSSVTNKEVEDVSKKFTTSFKIVPLEKLSNFKIQDMGKFHVVTDLSAEENGQKLADYSGDNTLNIPITQGELRNSNDVLDEQKVKNVTSNGAAEYVDVDVNDDENKVKVVGYYSGTEVEIPADHIALKNEGVALVADKTDELRLGDAIIDNVRAGGDGGLCYKDLYDISSSHFNSKDTTDTIEAHVYKENVGATGTITTNGAVTVDADKDYKVTAVKYTATISDTDRMLNEFIASDTYTMRPINTRIVLSRLMDETDDNSYSYDAKQAIVIKDQYGVDWYDKARYNLEYEYNVRNPIENKDGFVNGNFRVDGNASEDAVIYGAEIGDVFTVDITAKVREYYAWDDEHQYPIDKSNIGYLGGEVTKTVTITVGADSRCIISGSDNYYSDTVSDVDNDGNIKVHYTFYDDDTDYKNDTNQKVTPSTVRECLQQQLNELLGIAGYSK